MCLPVPAGTVYTVVIFFISDKTAICSPDKMLEKKILASSLTMFTMFLFVVGDHQSP